MTDLFQTIEIDLFTKKKTMYFNMNDNTRKNSQSRSHPSIQLVPVTEVELVTGAGLAFPALRHKPSGKVWALIGQKGHNLRDPKILREINKKGYEQLHYAKTDTTTSRGEHMWIKSRKVKGQFVKKVMFKELILLHESHTVTILRSGAFPTLCSSAVHISMIA